MSSNSEGFGNFFYKFLQDKYSAKELCHVELKELGKESKYLRAVADVQVESMAKENIQVETMLLENIGGSGTGTNEHDVVSDLGMYNNICYLLITLFCLMVQFRIYIFFSDDHVQSVEIASVVTELVETVYVVEDSLKSIVGDTDLVLPAAEKSMK